MLGVRPAAPGAKQEYFLQPRKKSMSESPTHMRPDNLSKIAYFSSRRSNLVVVSAIVEMAPARGIQLSLTREG